MGETSSGMILPELTLTRRNLPELGASSLAEKYLDFSSSLHMHFIFSCRFRHSAPHVNVCYLCAIFQRLPSGVERDLDRFSFINSVSHANDTVMLTDNEQDAVFIDEVEFRNYGEIAGLDGKATKVRSYVRLHLLDKCKYFRSNKRLDLFPGVIEGSIINADGKGGLTAATGGPATNNSELASQMVKGRPQIVNNVADDQCPIKLVGFDLIKGYLKAVPLCLGFDGWKMISAFRSTPGIESCCECKEMVVCPVDFGFN